MRIIEVWRYPVKSLHGELLDGAEITTGGMTGDRLVHVRNARGLVTGRQSGALLPVRATTGSHGPLVGGHAWRGPDAAELIRAAAGTDAELAEWSGPERFDVLPLLVSTEAEAARWGEDRRRLRPNLVITGADADEERSWPGRSLRIGPGLVIGVDSVRLRCIVTTYDPDTGARDPQVLRRIHREHDGRLALNCWVITPGRVSVGDEVRLDGLDEATVLATHPGYEGWVSGAPYDVPR